jgi:histidine ammonia-lyase
MIGTVKAFLPEIHQVRPGQNLAKRLRSLLHSEQYPSQISLDHKDCGMCKEGNNEKVIYVTKIHMIGKVQDSYTLRCIPQVHGVTHDTIQFVHGIISTEVFLPLLPAVLSNSSQNSPLSLSVLCR